MPETDKLYLPPEKLDLLFKYKTADEKEPRLSKLGGSEMGTDQAESIPIDQRHDGRTVEAVCSPSSPEGFSFSPDTPWQLQFEDAFPYEETRDQLKAIQ
jgi:transcription-repair coupling factor (superfamily II helicase)